MKRKRRWWGFVIVLLAIVGVGWWSVSRPPPLPEFLRKFEDQTTLEWSGRGYVYRAWTSAEDVYIVNAPAESVILAFADEAGDSNVGLQAWGLQQFEDPNRWVRIRAVIRAGARQSLVSVSHVHPLPWFDQRMQNAWSGWLNWKYGDPQYPVGDYDPIFNMEALIKQRPKLRRML